MIEKSKSIPYKTLALTGSLWIFSLFINFDIPIKLIALFALVMAGFWMNAIHRDFSGTVFSSSLWPAIFAHCCFDFWLYMEQSSAPWWVW